MSFILNKHKGILSELSYCFLDPPRVFFRRKRNLKDILCKSDIFSNSVKEETERNQPCNHGNCKLCSSIAASNQITNKHSNKKFEIKHGGTCRTKNIIYAAECRKHKKLYIGQSKCQLNKRFCGHRFDIKKISTKPFNKDAGGTELSENFSASPISQSDLRTTVPLVSYIRNSLRFWYYASLSPCCQNLEKKLGSPGKFGRKQGSNF